MKKIVLLLALALALGACKHIEKMTGGGGQVVGSGVSKVEKRNVPAFTSVDLSGAFEVEITAQKDLSVELEGDDNILPLIKTEVKNGVLTVGNSESISTKSKLRLKISVPTLDGISASGASDIVASGVKSDNFRIDTSGASNLQISGETKALEVEMSGAGEVDAKDFRAQKVNITSSGAAHADVYASEELTASVSGAGNVNYYGDPKVFNEDRSGAGTITKR
jgi:hypothetical protein